MDVNYTLSEIDSLAKKFLEKFPNPITAAFYAEMGTGKTSFIHAICARLGVTDDFGSPTFSIINEYRDNQGKPIFHIDLYRIKNADEARAAGVEECFYADAYCFVEWPENAFGLLPPEAVQVYMRIEGENERNLRIK